MSHYLLQAFGRSDVSDKERRLLNLGNVERSPGSEGSNEFYTREMQERHKREWSRIPVTDRAAADRLRWQQSLERETGRRTIPSASQLRYEHHIASARAAGKVVDGNYIDGTPAGIKAARDARLKMAFAESDRKMNADTALMRQEIAQGKPTWQMTYFHALPLVDQQRALANAMRRGENVPDEVLGDHGMNREDVEDRSASRSAEVFVSTEARPASGEFRPRSPRSVVSGAPSPVASSRFPDVAAGLYDKVPAERPDIRGKRPSPYHVEDPYTGGWKLDRAKVRDTNELTEYEMRSTEFRAAADAADVRLDKALADLRQKIATSSNPERIEYVKIHDRYRERRSADIDALFLRASEFAERVRDGRADPRDLSVVFRYSDDVRPYFARLALLTQSVPSAIDRLASSCQEDVRVLDASIAAQSKALFDDFVDTYVRAKQSLQSERSSFAEKKTTVLAAVAKINAFGAHMHRNERGTTISEEVREARRSEAEKTFEEKLPPNGRIVIEQILGDEEGIEKLLRYRSELLRELAKDPAADLVEKEAFMVALRGEYGYLERAGTADDRLHALGAEIDAYSDHIATLLKDRTDAIDAAEHPEEKIAAANRELLYLQTYCPENVDRIKALRERGSVPAETGIIASVRERQHSPLWTKTQDAVEAATSETPVDIRAALTAIRTEGSFITKHKSELPKWIDKRYSELLKEQGEFIMKLYVAEVAVAGNDPLKISEAIVASARELGRLRSSELNKTALTALEQALTDKVRAMRGPVNAAIVAARNEKPLTVPTVRTAVEMIAAESLALRALGIDPERVASIQKELSLLETLDTQVREVVSTGTRSAPDLAKFKEMSDLLFQEDTMVRTVFHADPQRLTARMASIEKQRKSLMESFNIAVDTAVKNLNEKTSTSADVTKASELLEEAFRQKGGDAMPDVQELGRLKAMREKVKTVRAAVAAQEERIKDDNRIAADIRRDVSKPNQTSGPEFPGIDAVKKVPQHTREFARASMPEPSETPPEIAPANVRRATVDASTPSIESTSIRAPARTTAPPSAPPPVPFAAMPKGEDDAALARLERLLPDEAVTAEMPTDRRKIQQEQKPVESPSPAPIRIDPPIGESRIPTNGPQEVSEEQQREDAVPLRQAEAIIVTTEADLLGGGKSVDYFNDRIALLRQSLETLDQWKDRFSSEAKQANVEKIDSLIVRCRDAEDKAMSSLQKTLVASGSPDDIRRAATIFEQRFKQLRVEERFVANSMLREEPESAIRDFSDVRRRLIDDLSGSPYSLLPRAVSLSMDDVVPTLRDALKKLKGVSPRPANES